MSECNHTGMAVDLSIADADEDWLAQIAPPLTHEGERMTPVRIRELAAEYRAKGYAMFPRSGCKNIGPDGDCLGCSSK